MYNLPVSHLYNRSIIRDLGRVNVVKARHNYAKPKSMGLSVLLSRGSWRGSRGARGCLSGVLGLETGLQCTRPQQGMTHSRL